MECGDVTPLLFLCFSCFFPVFRLRPLPRQPKKQKRCYITALHKKKEKRCYITALHKQKKQKRCYITALHKKRDFKTRERGACVRQFSGIGPRVARLTYAPVRLVAAGSLEIVVASKEDACAMRARIQRCKPRKIRLDQAGAAEDCRRPQ